MVLVLKIAIVKKGTKDVGIKVFFAKISVKCGTFIPVCSAIRAVLSVKIYPTKILYYTVNIYSYLPKLLQCVCCTDIAS